MQDINRELKDRGR